MADNDRSDIEDAEHGKEPTAPTEESASEKARRDARRRILAGGLAGAPLILTLTSRPALASSCSISAMGSETHLSHASQVTCRGLTPGFWKTHENQCEEYIIVGPCNPIYLDYGQCDDYSVPTTTELEEFKATLNPDKMKDRRKIEKVDLYLTMLENYPGLDSPPFGTPFSEVFGSGLTQDPTTTMMQALWLDDAPPLPPTGSGGSSPVLAHSAAAYLNAHEFGREVYGYSPQEIVDLVASRILTEPFLLKDDLEMLNQRG